MPKGVYKRTAEHNRKISEANTGKKRTEEQKKRTGVKKGYKQSEEHKRRESIAKKGNVPWNVGLTKETDKRVRKISESRLGKTGWPKNKKRGPPSPEHKRKIGEALKGKKYSKSGTSHTINETQSNIALSHSN